MTIESSPCAPAERETTAAASAFGVWLFVFSLIGYWAVLIHQLGAQWSFYEQYKYGWAVPFLCLYLLWRRFRSPAPAPSSLLSLSRSLLLPLLLCALLYAPTRFIHEANPIWRLTSLLLSIEVIGITLLCLSILNPQQSQWQQTEASLAGGIGRHSRFASVGAFGFPLCFFLVAVPWPSALEGWLTHSLMRANASLTVELLAIMGVPAVQHGNVIEVGTGMVGIDEACSGIRSSQATLMLSLFFGEFYRLTWRRRFGLLGLGFAIAFVFNLARTLLLACIAASKGITAMAHWHDPAGVTILAGCFLLLWLSAIRLRGNANPASEMTSAGKPCRAQVGATAGQRSALRRRSGETAPHHCISISFWSATPASRWIPALLLIWLILVEAGTEFWYRSHEHASSSMDWSLGAGVRAREFTRVDIGKEISSQFNYDQGTELRWRDSAGNAWQLYYLRWFPARSLNNRVAIQLAKSHGPEICLPAAGMNLQESLGTVRVKAKELEFALQQFRFSFEGRPIHVFYGIYEDPSGTELANRRLDSTSRVEAALAGSRNCGQRFVELAVSGPETSAAALAALSSQLPMLLDTQRSSP